MSSSCLKTRIHRSVVVAGICGTVTAGAAMLICPLAGAAQYYMQPRAEVSVEANTNVALDTSGGSKTSEGYLGDIGAKIGIATPRSETTLTPRLQYQNYPDYKDANRLEGYLDLASNYRSERSALNVYGRYDHEDGLHADLPSAQFDPLNPTLRTTPETGRVRVGATRDLIWFNPNYSYRLTQRWNLDLSAQYQRIEYNPSDSSTFVNFDYYQTNVGLSRSVTQRSDLSLGAHAAKYEARGIDSNTNGVGADLGLETRWSGTLVGKWHVSFEQDKIDQGAPAPRSDTERAWGADFSLTRKQEISTVIFSIGRTVTPSGSGGMYYANQAQMEYDRDLSRRLSLISAVRFLREDSLALATAANSSRDYLQGLLQLRWQITRTWFIRGGYQYIWQKYEVNPSGAANHNLSLSFGYEGLAPQR